LSDDPAAARLLTLCLEKALRKGPEGLRPLTALPADSPGWLRQKFNEGVIFHQFVPDAALDARVRHVADWIAAAVINDEPWLKNVDERGRPKKLLKIGSLAQAEAEADKHMRHFAFKVAAAPFVEGAGEETVMMFADGNRIVRGAYDAGVQDLSRIIYSLRDRQGREHLTFNVKAEGNELLQCRSKQNEPPIARYMPHVRLFIESQRLVLKESASVTGLVQDVEGRIHSIAALPEGLTVDGDLDLNGAAITALPEGLKVGGNLYLRGTAIMALPEGLKVDGYLDLRSTAITVLPEGLKVGGSLDLSYLAAITALPEGLEVGGFLGLSSTAITALPKGLKVGESLYLGNTAITALPEGLTVDGNLSLNGAAITSLPEGLKVAGYLDLGNTAITALPKELKVGGNLDLYGTAITALPEGLKVGGNLDLRGTAITALPAGLKVGGNLDLYGTAITALPEGLMVGTWITKPDGRRVSLRQMAALMLPNGPQPY